jgi:hypothetical protein
MSAGGVEMEAMTAAAIAALTIVDMVLGLDPTASVRSVRLVSTEADGERQTLGAPSSNQPSRPPRGARIAGRFGEGPRRDGPRGPYGDHSPHKPPRR